MRVYVESNFVLELALEQEQSKACEAILSLATAGQISLVVPTYCLTEPFETTSRRHRERNELSARLTRELREIGRTARFTSEAASSTVSVLLVKSAPEAATGLDKTLGRLLTVAEVSPLTADILVEAGQHRMS